MVWPTSVSQNPKPTRNNENAQPPPTRPLARFLAHKVGTGLCRVFRGTKPPCTRDRCRWSGCKASCRAWRRNRLVRRLAPTVMGFNVFSRCPLDSNIRETRNVSACFTRHEAWRWRALVLSQGHSSTVIALPHSVSQELNLTARSPPMTDSRRCALRDMIRIYLCAP